MVSDDQTPGEFDVSWILMFEENIPYGIPTFMAGYQSGYNYSLTQLPHGDTAYNWLRRIRFNNALVIQFTLEVVSYRNISAYKMLQSNNIFIFS